ncbi:hypothetical protein QF036_002067 [Arthrobacter globiformis]|nr:hypothetical protein [Arthrobacter globiformis]
MRVPCRYLMPTRFGSSLSRPGRSVAERLFNDHLGLLPVRTASIVAGLAAVDREGTLNAVVSLKVTSAMAGAVQMEKSSRELERQLHVGPWSKATAVRAERSKSILPGSSPGRGAKDAWIPNCCRRRARRGKGRRVPPSPNRLHREEGSASPSRFGDGEQSGRAYCGDQPAIRAKNRTTARGLRVCQGRSKPSTSAASDAD